MPDATPSTVASRLADAALARLDLAGCVGQLVMTPNLDPAHDAEAIRAGRVGSTVLASGPFAGRHRDGGAGRERTAALHEIAAAAGIPLLVARDVIHGHRTIFPIPLGLAASFDEGLVEETSAWAAAEASADGIDWVFAPMVDVVDDPRWGRVAESYGESPRVVSRMGVAAVRGFQRSGRVAACAKHFVGYGAVRGGRDYAAIDLGPTALRDRYLPPFRAAVDAGVLSVMAAFPALDGVPLHAHRDLLRGVLRDEWGFDGVVVSDWDGVGELVAHGVARDRRDAARLAIEAGVDVDMASECYADHLVGLAESGDVDPALVDEAARRVLLMKARLGMFDGGADAEGVDDPAFDDLAAAGAAATSRRIRDERTGDPRVTGPRGAGHGEAHEALATDSRAARALAGRAARAAIVLAQTDGRPPIPADGRVHLVGPFVHDGTALLGTWVLDGDPARVVTPARAFHALYGDRLDVDDGRFADLAGVHAREASVTVALVGEHPRRSGEDSAVAHIDLPAGQLELLRLLRRTADRLVVVVVSGRPIASGELRALADVLVLSGHPGIAADEIAHVLAGAELGGRLPITWPDVSGTSPGWTGEAPTGRPVALSRYIDLRDPPALPLGAGRSWSEFEIRMPRLSASVVSPERPVTIEVDVTNTGDRAGRELVLLRATPAPGLPSRGSDLLDWSWAGFRPGETETVRFTVTSADVGDRLGTAHLHVGPHTVALDVRD